MTFVNGKRVFLNPIKKQRNPRNIFISKNITGKGYPLNIIWFPKYHKWGLFYNKRLVKRIYHCGERIDKYLLYPSRKGNNFRELIVEKRS